MKEEIRGLLMRLAGFIPRVIVTMALVPVAYALGAQGASSQLANIEQAKASAEMPQFEDVEQRIGPFSLKGENFIVALHDKRLPGASDSRFAQTLATIEVRDAKGAVLYQKTFPQGC